MPRRSNGLFVVLEGPDKAGKSTQAELLLKALRARGLTVLRTREPGGARAAEAIREVLLDPRLNILPWTELFLYEAARVQHVEETIKPALAEGKVVLCDRFTLSSEVYQGLARGLDLRAVRTLNAIAARGIKPDLTLVIDVPGATFHTRRRSGLPDRLELENAAFRKRVRDGYRRLARARPKTAIVDGSRPPADVHREILRRVARFLP